MPKTLLIQGCAVVAGEKFLEQADLLIAGGRIRKIAPRIAAGGARVIPGAGLLAAPGLIDTQINGGFGHSFSGTSPEEVLEVGKRTEASMGTSGLGRVCLRTASPSRAGISVADRSDTVSPPVSSPFFEARFGTNDRCGWVQSPTRRQ